MVRNRGRAPTGTERGQRPGRPSFLAPGLLLGAGLGGFFDGIVFHQILGWHHLLSATPRHSAATLDGLQANMTWDGLFHAATFLMVCASLVLLWRALQSPGRLLSGRGLLGLVLAGWGLFNLVEGVIDHHLLGLHHVRPGQYQSVFDLGFLGLGALLLLVGSAMYRHR